LILQGVYRNGGKNAQSHVTAMHSIFQFLTYNFMTDISVHKLTPKYQSVEKMRVKDD